MSLLIYIGAFLIGLFFGSFLNLIADRVVRGEQVLKVRSHCESCNKPLKAKNLIPVLSYIFQKGKCSHCSAKLSLYYPLSEVLTGLAFVYALYTSNLIENPGVLRVLGFINILVIFWAYIILFLADAKYRLVPDKVVLPAIVFAFLMPLAILGYSLFMYRSQLLNDKFGLYLIDAGFWHLQVASVLRSILVVLGSSLGIGMFFLLLVLVTGGRGMGGGDIRLGILIGLFNGFPGNILAVFLGFVIGALYSIVLLLFRRKGLKDTIAFGPFLLLGSLISYQWGSLIINWYLSMF